MRSTFLFLLILLGGTISAQSTTPFTAEELEQLEASEDTLGVLGYSIVNDTLAEDRFIACRAFIPRLVTALKTPHSFHYPFEQLQSVSIQYPADSSFRIFTWQLMVDPGEFRYYGAIQMNTPELKLFPLRDRSFELQKELEQAAITPDQWYGNLVYRVHQFDTENGMRYLLFGFDGYDGINRRKLVDVLSFDASGQPQLGAPVFVSNDPTQPAKNRIVLEYASDVSVTCNYDVVQEMIVFDHLIMIAHPSTGEPVRVPDGSYEGYRFENGRWVYVEKVFDHIYDSPPIPDPKFNDPASRKSLFNRGGR